MSRIAEAAALPNTDVVWHLYLLRVANGHLYTGITTDVQRRFLEHQQGGRGAKALRGKGPLLLALQCPIGTRNLALRVELAVKALRKSAKERLLSDPAQLQQLIAQCAATSVPNRSREAS